MTDGLPRSGSPVPDDHHVLRYIAPRHVENGVVNGEGFLKRPGEDASSVNWLEHFDSPLENQVEGVRSAARLRYAKTGQLARLQVGATATYVRQNSPDGLQLSFVHDPLPVDGDFVADPSHALIKGVPVADSVEAALIKDLLADCILPPLFPAVPKAL
jgi:hypothetical protein